MGGKVYDRRRLPIDRDPLKQLAVEVGKFPKPDPAKALEKARDLVRDYLIGAFKDVTGIDLESWTKFLDALPGFDTSKIISGTFGDGFLPGLGLLRDAIGQAIDGGTATGYTLALVKSRLENIPSQNIVSLAASKVIGTLADANIPALAISKITGLSTSLAALLPTSLFSAKIAAGSNLVLDPGIDVAEIWTASGVTSAGTVRSSEWSRSGTYALKMTGPSQFARIPADTTGYKTITAGAGDKFYVETWVYPKGTNTAGGIASIGSVIADSKGVNADIFPSIASVTLTTANRGQWIKVAGYYTVPAGYDRVRFSPSSSAGVPAADVLYWDDLLIREVTESQNVIATAIAALGGAGSGLTGLTAALLAIPGGNIGSVISTAVVPDLDTSKTTTGNWAQTRVTGLVADLGAAATAAANALGTANTASSNTATVVDNIVNWLGGKAGTGNTAADTAQPLADAAATLAANTAAIAALQNEQGGNQNGRSFFVDFTKYPDSANLPAIFTPTYSASLWYGGTQGSSTFGIESGRAKAIRNNSNPRACVGTYNVAPLLSDYQTVGAIWDSVPDYNPFTGGRGINILTARSNAASTSRVHAFIGSNFVQLCCYVAGVKTTFHTLGAGGSGSFSFKAGAAYFLRCGTAGSLRTFEVVENSKVIISYTEVGTTSQVGANFRFPGLGADWYETGFGGDDPSTCLAWAASDTQPGTYPGSGGVMTKTTGSANIVAGQQLVPANLYNNLEYASDDITPDQVNGRFTVKYSGWYEVSIGYRVGTAPIVTHYFAPAVARSVGGIPTFYKLGQDGYQANSSGFSFVTVYPRYFSMSWIVPLQAGQFVQAAYDTSANVNGFIGSDAAGAGTYFQISMLNRSLS